MRIINDDRVDNAVECAICTNPTHNDTGCGGCSKVYRHLAAIIYDIIDGMTVKCETNLDVLKALFPGVKLEFTGEPVNCYWKLTIPGACDMRISSKFYEWLNKPYDSNSSVPKNL